MSSLKGKTRRHLMLNRTKMVLSDRQIPVMSYVNTSASVFKSPPKPRLLKDPKIGRAILVSDSQG